MFEESLIESAGVLKTKRPAAAVVSLLLQCVLVAVLAGLPLLYTEALPRVWSTSLVAPGPPPGAPAPERASQKRRAPTPPETDMLGSRLRQPRAIPPRVARIEENDAPPEISAGPGVPGGTGDPSASGVLNAIVNLAPPAVAPQPSFSRPVRVSQGVAQGLLVRGVRPLYPPLARQARIQGTVILRAIVGKDGSIENLQLVSGHPMLAAAAIEAVRQWRYRPYTLNGAPVEVETEITVNFVLGSGSGG